MVRARPRFTDPPLSPHLQAPTGTVLCEDTDVGGVGAGTHKPGQVVILHIPHLQVGATIRSLTGTSLSTKLSPSLKDSSLSLIPYSFSTNILGPFMVIRTHVL